MGPRIDFVAPAPGSMAPRQDAGMPHARSRTACPPSGRIATATMLLVLLWPAAVPAAGGGASVGAVPGELLIKFRPGAAASEQASLRGALRGGLVRRFRITGAELWRVPERSMAGALDRARRHPLVEYAEPNFELAADVVPNDPLFAELYALRNSGQSGGLAGADIRATLAWEEFTGDPSLKIGILDTGVDYRHPDLAANIWTNPGEIPDNGLDDDANGYVDDVHGYDVLNGDGDPLDDNGHGTHCAGTVAAVAQNGEGVTGVAWRASVVPIKFLSAAGSGTTAGAIAALDYALAAGVRLTSNSWGGGAFSLALLDAIERSGEAGQLFVAAAGNASSNNDVTPHYPSSYASPCIVAVAASDASDRLASFSNFGPIGVDLAAPGASILSTLPGNRYGRLSGTSMAAPHVAGTLALAMGRFPALPALRIKSLLLSAVDPLPVLEGRVASGGRLNAHLVLAEADVTPPGAVADLSVAALGSTSLRLAWSATGDDGGSGRATRYEIRFGTAPIDEANFASALPATGPEPAPAGSRDSVTIGGLAFRTRYYVAIRAVDEFEQAGALSNLVSVTTLGPPRVEASPSSFAAALASGASEVRTLTLRNTGEGVLEYSLPPPPLLVGAASAPVYRWIDSEREGGPRFAWVDPSAGEAVALTGDDAISAPLALGFSFPFYGARYDAVRLCTDGWLSFTASAPGYDDQPLPAAAAPENLIAPLWDDLDFGVSPRARILADGARFVATWSGATRRATGEPVTFQAILEPSGEIRFQYGSVGTSGVGTIGLQDAEKAAGLTIAHDEPYVRDGMAIRIAPIREWLTLGASDGSLAAGESAAIPVRLDATGMSAGLYAGNVRLECNDPATPAADFPVALEVWGAPDLAVTPQALDFGGTFAGESVAATLTFANPGTDTLHVVSISGSDGSVTALPATTSIPPFGSREVRVIWSPPLAGPWSGLLHIVSDDLDAPLRSIPLSGSAAAAPSFTVSPESLIVSLNVNAVTTRLVRVANTGATPLDFTAAASVAAAGDQAPTGLDGASSAGGSDAFGYTLDDSDTPGGPSFLWEDVRAVGTPIAMTGDDQNAGPFPIGFPFPFYGATYDSFRVCTNGWVSFTSGRTSYANTTLPNAGTLVPENLLAVFWDDLTFNSARRATFHADGARLVVQFQDVARFGESAGNSFEVVLHADGTVLYQYLAVSASAAPSATVGIQNAARDDGLLAAFNTAYARSGLAVRFRPPGGCMSVTPASGTIAVGDSADLAVRFDAGGLRAGAYGGVVRIAAAGSVSAREMPVRLQVTGAPDLAAAAALSFGTIPVGGATARELLVENRGTETLHLTSLALLDPAFGVAGDPIAVPPKGTALLLVSFHPSRAGGAAATLTIGSDDPDSPAFDVSLAGEGILPPDVEIAPLALAASLPAAESTTRTITIANRGSSDLVFSIAPPASAATAAGYVDGVELGKGEDDPRVGIEGSGGPDQHGYTWRDSDDPDGPSFAWIDLSDGGATLPLTGDDATATGIPLGFEFPFYGARFTAVNVSTNGWISFTSGATTGSNQPIPNAGPGVPENLLAAFWDDLAPAAGSRVVARGDSARFVVSWEGVPRFGSGGPYTFQIVLTPDGRILFQYRSMAGLRLDEATIGIQNGARSDGLLVAHNATYARDSLAVEFSATPAWISVSPTAGRVTPGAAEVVTVTLRRAGLPDGEYDGALRIATTDPDEPVLLVPIRLSTLPAPDVVVAPPTVDFGTVAAGAVAEESVVLENLGNATLTITSLRTTDGPFSIASAPPTPLTLPAGERAVVRLSYRPPVGAGASSDSSSGFLAGSSDDPDGEFRIPLSGAAAVPTGVGESGSNAPLSFSLGIAGRHPAASGPILLRLAAPSASRLTLLLYDVRGALVRRLATGRVGAGWHWYRWDGTDDRGRTVGSGVYFARASLERRNLTARIVVVR